MYVIYERGLGGKVNFSLSGHEGSIGQKIGEGEVLVTVPHGQGVASAVDASLLHNDVHRNLTKVQAIQNPSTVDLEERLIYRYDLNPTASELLPALQHTH